MLAESARRLRRTTTIPSTSMGGGEGGVTAVQYDILIFFLCSIFKEGREKEKNYKEIKKKKEIKYGKKEHEKSKTTGRGRPWVPCLH